MTNYQETHFNRHGSIHAERKITFKSLWHDAKKFLVPATLGILLVACGASDKNPSDTNFTPSSDLMPISQPTPAFAKETLPQNCNYEVNTDVLPPLPHDLSLTGMNEGSYYREMELSTRTGHVVRETTSFMIAAKTWRELGAKKFYDDDSLNTNGPSEYLKIIADITECVFGKSITQIPDRDIFDLSQPVSFLTAQKVATYLDSRDKKILRGEVQLPPLPDFYPPNQKPEFYDKLDNALANQVVISVENALKIMRASSNHRLIKYAQVLDRLRAGVHPAPLIYTFGFDRQLSVPNPVQLYMPKHDEALWGQGYIAQVPTYHRLSKNNEFLFELRTFNFGLGFTALTRDGEIVAIVKEASMAECTLGLLNATTKPGK